MTSRCRGRSSVAMPPNTRSRPSWVYSMTIGPLRLMRLLLLAAVLRFAVSCLYWGAGYLAAGLHECAPQRAPVEQGEPYQGDSEGDLIERQHGYLYAADDEQDPQHYRQVPARRQDPGRLEQDPGEPPRAGRERLDRAHSAPHDCAAWSRRPARRCCTVASVAVHRAVSASVTG